MNSKILQRIKQLALSNAKEEICGFIFGETDLTPQKNIHSNPQSNFRIQNKDLKTAIHSSRRRGVILSIYHSHCKGLPEFSKVDTININKLEKIGVYTRWVLYHIPNDSFLIYLPSNLYN